MKEKEDGFIGEKFTTPKGGILTVKERYSSGKHPKYICECSICSKDKELWPYGSIIGDKNTLLNAGCCCGCSKSNRWSEDQNYIRVKRKCSERGYIFHGWYGDYNKSKTYLDLENPITGNRWNSTNLFSFLGGSGDPVEGLKKISDAKFSYDEQHIQDFHKAGFSKDYKFWRSERKDSQGYLTFWNYTCPICSKDAYVSAGVCKGVFEGHIGSLKEGRKSCRCYKAYRWSQGQREYQIKGICKEEGLIFIGWKDPEGYTSYKSKFLWVCSEGHERETSVDDFLQGKRCRVCYVNRVKSVSGFYGYYPDRAEEQDYLYIIKFGNNYLKVGRSFNILQRFNHLTWQSGISQEDIEILQLYTSNHQVVYDTEQWLHEELRERGFEYNEEDGLWSIELFSLDCISVLEYLLNHTTLSLHRV